jgi:hypothetical protein
MTTRVAPSARQTRKYRRKLASAEAGSIRSSVPCSSLASQTLIC